MKKTILAGLMFLATFAYADNLQLNVGKLTLSVPASNLQVAYFYDIDNSRNLTGFETNVADYNNIVDLNIGGITVANNQSAPEISLTYTYKTKSLILTELQLGIWTGNDNNLQNGRIINMYGLKAAIPLIK